ncbi:hypothetical protein PPYR_04537 [Photinus pyralis]|uniref:Terpene synthase n=1 Tax=Photinus pyralis TaxID=7054 RepID=A0A5N4AYB5_PHOPY|nr:farnesyl pyrophosphate synthase-like [Photinus pyralis]KAB0802351.1 hypothetical protein PPYR_04537 [Photinus pyralis]
MRGRILINVIKNAIQSTSTCICTRHLSQQAKLIKYHFNALLPNGINLAESNNDFHALYPTLFNDLKDSYGSDYNEVFERFDFATRYNILNRNYRLCFPIINVYALLIPDGRDTTENRMLAHVLDWCMEFLASGCLLQDDMVDQSDTRWRKPCWYQIDSIGKTAMCDTKMMEMATYMLLKKYFSKFPYYKQILNIFTETYFLTALGQSQDINMSANYQERRKLRILTHHAFYSQYYYKTYFFTCRMSVYLGMYVTGRNYSEYHDVIDNLIERMADVQQVQNDAWDCFGSSKKYGKVGNDIRNGKATWLIATAQKLADTRQLRLLKENYGQGNLKSFEIVRKIYDELDILGHYKAYKTDEIAKLHRDIDQISADPLKQVMYQCIDIYDVRDQIVLDGDDPKVKTDLHTFT